MNLVKDDKETKTFLRSGDMARLAEVSADTLRHYERKGLIPAPRRSANGYREYPVEIIERFRLIRRALSIGFTLDELAVIFKARRKGKAPCRDVRQLAQKKLSEIETRLDEITRLRDQWLLLLEDWDARLAKTEADEPARLLETLSLGDGAFERISPLVPVALNRKRKG